MDDERHRTAVIIPTFDGASLTRACVATLLENPPAGCMWRLVVVDDGSFDQPERALSEFGDQVELVRLETNSGFASACNAGARAAADCEFLVFLNNDTVPTRGWLDALLDDIQRDSTVAAAGAKLLYPNGLVQHAGVAICQDGWPRHIYAGFPRDHPAVNYRRYVTAATGACLLVRQEDFAALDGFDPAFRNGYEDVDLCLRLRKRGRRVSYCPTSVVFHLESVTRGPDGIPEGTESSESVYQQRWRERVEPDDLQRYAEDGLLRFEYSSHHPLTLSVEPELATIRVGDAEPSRLERILAERTREVMKLMSANIRHELRSPGGNGRSQRRRDPILPDLVRTGAPHNLGPDRPGPLLSLVLVVKDAGRSLRGILDAVLAQDLAAQLEIVAVDSGSTDNTVEILERFNATVLTIPPDAFNHGATRNLGTRHARGDILVFLSQNARPVGTRWLAPLIRTLTADPATAGVCSRVLPPPGVDLLSAKDGLDDRSSRPTAARVQIDDWTAYSRMSPAERRELLAFHSVSAAVRAEVVRNHPFEPVCTIGEDVLWARHVLESGWALRHEPGSVVHHSHAYSLAELFGRYFDDGVFESEYNARMMSMDEMLRSIETVLRSDWSYLRSAAGLTEAELERWRTQAVLRRVAQRVGWWAGVNHEQFPAHAFASLSGVHHARGKRQPDLA